MRVTPAAPNSRGSLSAPGHFGPQAQTPMQGTRLVHSHAPGSTLESLRLIRTVWPRVRRERLLSHARKVVFSFLALPARVKSALRGDKAPVAEGFSFSLGLE